MFSISGWSVVAAYISTPQNCNIAELTVRNVYQSVNSYNWFYKNGSCKDGKKPCIVVWHQLTMYVKWARLDEFITVWGDLLHAYLRFRQVKRCFLQDMKIQGYDCIYIFLSFFFLFNRVCCIKKDHPQKVGCYKIHPNSRVFKNMMCLR